MGQFTEGEPRNETFIDPKEQDLFSILTSKNPLDVLDHVAKPHKFHLMQDEHNRLIGQLRNPDEEVRKQARQELTWYCLPTVNAVVQKYRECLYQIASA